MLLGLLEPDAGTVSVFGAPPREAVDAGAVGAMLQTGALIRDLTVRELVEMMASLYPAPAPGRRGARARPASRTIAGRRTQKLSGGQTQRVRFAVALVSEPRAARARRADGGDGRRGPRTDSGRRCATFAARGKTVLFATHYLEEADAYADRVVLMAHGAVVADGPPNEIKAMVGTRTIRATLPDAPLEELERLPGRHARRAARRGGRARLQRLGRRRSARCSPTTPTRATSRSPAPGSSRRSSS